MANITTLDLGPVRQVYKGEYSPTVPYDLLNTVFYQGESWVMIKTPYMAGTTPAIDSPYWQKIAVKGLDGDVSTLIPKTGDRGVLGGYETTQYKNGSVTISISSDDTTRLNTKGAFTLTFNPADIPATATKVIGVWADTASTLNISGALWANNADAPKWGGAGELLILVANFIHGRVLLSVFHNSEG